MATTALLATAPVLLAAVPTQPWDGVPADIPTGHHDSRVVNSSTIDGKLMFGYQGWFDVPADGAGLSSQHSPAHGGRTFGVCVCGVIV